MRDYLNEGGKALVTGKYNQYAQGADGSYWYNPFQPPECTTPGAYPCLPLLDDFQQYWLGAYDYLDGSGQDGTGAPVPLAGDAGAFAGFDATLNGAGSANNQDHTAAFLTTSSFLPPDIPAVRQRGPGRVGRRDPLALQPVHRCLAGQQPTGRRELEAADPHHRPHRGDQRLLTSRRPTRSESD